MVKDTNKGEIPQESDFDSLFKTEETFKEFLRILTVTGQIGDEKLSELEKGKVVDQYLVWKEQGMQKPKLPASVERGVEVILRIYRRKELGKQWLSYVVKGQHEQVGIKSTPIYGSNNGVEDRSIIIGYDKKPTIEYTEKKARELLAKAKRYTDNVQLRLVYQTVNIAVKNEENFFADFDEMVAKAMQKNII